MNYCKGQHENEKVDCSKCHAENNLIYDFCCLNECGEHEFCRGCIQKWKERPIEVDSKTECLEIICSIIRSSLAEEDKASQIEEVLIKHGLIGD